MMVVADNTLAVRRYYAKHRSVIIQSKTLNACRTVGRVPRLTTIRRHDLSLHDLEAAFKDWLQVSVQSEFVKRKRTLKIHALLESD